VNIKKIWQKELSKVRMRIKAVIVSADYYDSAMDDFLGSGDFDRAAANLDSEIRVRDLVAGLNGHFRIFGRSTWNFSVPQF
jgi:hypothetical protein